MSLIDASPPSYSMEDHFLNVLRPTGSSGVVQDGMMRLSGRQPAELLTAGHCGRLRGSVGKLDRFPKEKSGESHCLA